MSRQQERESNLIVVAAVEEYGARHHIPVKEVLSLFRRYDITDLLRSQHKVLHTMDLGEGASFAESVLQGAAL
ncbi:MAG: DUF3791 domain-containing protein [Eubacteriales bacterium]|nr:DUF3791 domain-containing protein [Eubacteriales bacterium]